MTHPQKTPAQKRILDRLKKADLTYELGVETYQAGISFEYWPYRCLSAKEFKRGYRSKVTAIEVPNLTISKDRTP